MMFSATIPSFIEKLATEVLSNPIFLSVGPPSTPNRFVKQIILWVEERSKKKRLFDLISDGKHFIPPVVIFVGSKIGADMLADALNKVGVKYEHLSCIRSVLLSYFASYLFFSSSCTLCKPYGTLNFYLTSFIFYLAFYVSIMS